MTCTFCRGRGVVRVRYHETPDLIDFGICQCTQGQKFRSVYGRLALAASLRVESVSIACIEELFEPDELPSFPRIGPSQVDLADIGRTRRRAKL